MEGPSRGIRVVSSLGLALGLLLPAGLARAQDHRVLGDAPELGAWVEAAALPLMDDGQGADAVAGDGVFTAAVPVAAAALPGPRTLRWRVLPDGATLASGAVGQADGTAMRIDLPDEQARTLEFRFTPLAPSGFGPEPSLADSWTTGWATDPAARRSVAFLAQGGFQSHFGGVPWNAAEATTTLVDDGVPPDALGGDGISTRNIVLPIALDPATELEWSVGVAGATAIDRSLELGADGWGFAADGVSPAPFSLALSPWQPGRFEFDRLRGMARQITDDAAFEAPAISEISDDASALSWVELVNPGSASLSLDGLFLTDDPGFWLLPSSLPPMATAGDALAVFPPGTVLPPGDYLVITWPGSGDFFSTHGRFPDLELMDSVAAVPRMLPAHPGAIDPAPTLSAAGEFLLLGRFDPGDPLVEDVDLVTWGAPAAADLPPDRSGLTPTGSNPAHGPEQGTVRSSFAPGVGLHARKALDEAGERRVACSAPCVVNGVAAGLPSGLRDPARGARHDETSEPLGTTWALPRESTPGAPNAVDRFVTGQVEDASGTAIELADVEAIQGPNRRAAVSSASGGFRLGPLDQGLWTFQASKAGLGRSPLQTLAVEGDTSLPSPLVLDGATTTHRLSGVVLETGSGSGLTGANITATPGGAVGVAGAAGAYQLDLPAGAYTLVASASGYGAVAVSVVLGSDQSRNFSLATGTPSVAVSGGITETGGAPLAGVRLSLEAAGVATFVTTSAADGSFVFPAVVPETTYRLEATTAGYLSAGQDLPVAAASVGGLSLVLDPRPPTFTISGTVLDARDDTPLVGATVLIEGGGSTESDAAGAYAIGGLGDGAQTLLASADGFATTRQDLTLVGADQSGVMLRLAADRRFLLGGQILDGIDGSPLPGATLLLTEDSSGSTTDRTADGRGGFSWLELLPGSYTLRITATDYLPAEQAVVLEANTQLSISLDPDPDRRVSLSGTIALEGLDAGSWEGTEVTLSDGSTPAVLTTDAGGAYRFDDLPPGTYELLATHPGFLQGHLDFDLLRSDQQDLLLGADRRAESPEPGCGCAQRSRGEPDGLLVLGLLGLFLVGRQRRG